MAKKNAVQAIQRGGAVLDKVQRDGDLTYSGAPEIYGGTGDPLFDCYVDDALMSLSFMGRYNPLMDWVGWDASNEHRMHRAFVTYAAGAGAAAGTPNSGRSTDPCAPGTQVEWGKCDWTKVGFGKLRRATPVRSDDEIGLRYNNALVTKRIDGTPITDEREWDMIIATSALVDDLHREIIVGNGATAGSSDGLQQMVTYGYEDSEGEACTAMDSLVIDWNGLPLVEADSDTGTDAISINGVDVADGTYSFYNFVRGAMRRIRTRIASTPMLSGTLNSADMALVMPQSWVSQMLDLATCWQLCGGDTNRMGQFEARAFRDSLNGGLYGAGTFPLDGLSIPILAYDHSLINADGTADMYLLNRGPANMPFIRGQYKDMNQVVARKPQKYGAMDGGKLLTWSEEDNTCERRNVEMMWRLLMPAPWAQVRFQNVPLDDIFGAISSDPISDFFIEQNMVAVS